jgi:hypothetical protein
MFDIGTMDIPVRMDVVSRKRTRALGDLYNMWKKRQMSSFFEDEYQTLESEDMHLIPWKDLPMC